MNWKTDWINLPRHVEQGINKLERRSQIMKEIRARDGDKFDIASAMKEADNKLQKEGY